MQRSVAVSGPTPAMIRWTVVRDCGLRRLGGPEPADAASRQLRGLTTWSKALRDRREYAGWCFHPDCNGGGEDRGAETLELRPADWLVFPRAEPLVAFGGEENVRRHCRVCPVNLDHPEDGVAGCWGWLPFELDSHDSGLGSRTLTLASGERLELLDASKWLAAVLNDSRARRSFEQLFPVTHPPWFGLWLGSEWNPEQCRWWISWTAPGPAASAETSLLVRLTRAVRVACETGLPFVFERVPPGVAEGQTWLWPRHCGQCGHVRPGDGPCGCCGEPRSAVGPWRRRVMGLRPWLQLSRLMTDDQIVQLAHGYRAFRKQAER